MASVSIDTIVWGCREEGFGQKVDRMLDLGTVNANVKECKRVNFEHFAIIINGWYCRIPDMI